MPHDDGLPVPGSPSPAAAAAAANAADAPAGRHRAAFIGAAFGLFSLGALAAALVLEAPPRDETLPRCADCGIVEAVQRTPGAYRLTVRMGDGSRRTTLYDQALPLGHEVELEGDHLTR